MYRLIIILFASITIINCTTGQGNFRVGIDYGFSMSEFNPENFRELTSSNDIALYKNALIDNYIKYNISYFFNENSHTNLGFRHYSIGAKSDKYNSPLVTSTEYTVLYHKTKLVEFDLSYFYRINKFTYRITFHK